MTDLTDIPTADLQAEIQRRKTEAEERHAAEIRAAHPCPECGAPPTKITQTLREQIRSAPRTPDGEIREPHFVGEGTLIASIYDIEVECENGHLTHDEKTITAA